MQMSVSLNQKYLRFVGICMITREYFKDLPVLVFMLTASHTLLELKKRLFGIDLGVLKVGKTKSCYSLSLVLVLTDIP